MRDQEPRHSLYDQQLAYHEVQHLRAQFRHAMLRRVEKHLPGLADHDSRKKAASRFALACHAAGLEQNENTMANMTTDELRQATRQTLSGHFNAHQNNLYRDAMEKRFDDKNGTDPYAQQHRFYFTLDSVLPETETERNVTSALQQEGYRVLNYVEGSATDRKGTQVYKIGKLLGRLRLGKLQNAFARDEKRLIRDHLMVLTNRTNDLARLLPHTGTTKQADIKQNIADGAFVVALVGEGDPYMLRPLAVASLHPYQDENGRVAYKTSQVTGTLTIGFAEGLEKMERHISGKKAPAELPFLSEPAQNTNSFDQKRTLHKTATTP